MTHPDPLIVGLTGRAGAGKDTAASYLCRRYGFVQVAFADTLRSMLAAMLDDADLDPAWLTERQAKERPIPALHGVTPRRLLQTLGTEWGRSIHPDLWVDVLARRTGIATGAPVHDRIVISDVRFPNEVTFVRFHGGQLLRLRREATDWEKPTHVSEGLVSTLGVDEMIDNSGTLGQLEVALDGWCRMHGIDLREPVEN
jgi:hypothetical protein